MQRIPIYRGHRVRRRLFQLVMFIYAASILGCIGIVVGPAINDYTIDSNPGRTLARVTATDNSPLITAKVTVEYQDEEGVYHSPETGILYPTGLGVGQRVWVTYAKSDPELVKVQGREWTLSIIPALSTLVAVTGICIVLAGIVHYSTKRYRHDPDQLEQPPRIKREKRVIIAPRTS